MAKQTITPKNIPQPLVPLSRGVKSGNLVFVSGTAPYGENRYVAKGDFPAQMKQSMENVKSILEAAGSSMDKVLKVNVILARISDFDAMNEIYQSYFTPGSYPARTTIEAKLHGKDFLLELECVAEA